jgi:hypothetical protein
MREEEPPVHREGEKYLGAGKVYVFVGRDDWEEFRNEVQEAESRLAEGDSEGGLDLIRNSLDMSKGLA